jgi:hypothetical protein
MPSPKPPHRPSVSEIALALANRRTEPVQTVGLTRNAKGDIQIAVEVNGADVSECGRLAEREFKRLDRLFPLSAAQKAGQKA